MPKTKDKKVGIFTLVSQPPSFAELIAVMQIIDNYDTLILCFKMPEEVMPIRQVQQMWELALRGFMDKIILTSWNADFQELTILPEPFQTATVLTLSKKVFAHLNSVGINCKLAPKLKGYHSTFMRKAYREGISLDYILQRYG